ncbi:hypothetical protein CPB86DRAFT_820455 [Serendipita vermifera]|nr:hypothetical protein CPB86DRAFT_820455 [Serendipita vermifera]
MSMREGDIVEEFEKGTSSNWLRFRRQYASFIIQESPHEMMARLDSNAGFYGILPRRLKKVTYRSSRSDGPQDYTKNAVYIHCLGLCALTYFATSQWDIQSIPRSPCTVNNFTLTKPLATQHNFQAATVFWQSFSMATLAGFYSARTMGTYFSEKEVKKLFVLVVEAQITFQDSAKHPGASTEDLEHYNQERSNARCIAKWLSICFVAKSSGAKDLVQVMSITGADVCSSEESDQDGENPIVLKTKSLPWRSRQFNDFILFLWEQSLYFNGEQIEQRPHTSQSGRKPPTKIPSS